MPPSPQTLVDDGASAPNERPPGALRAIAVEENRRAFLRTASHELRTPLNAIIGFSEIIARELHGPMNEPRYRQHADMIHQAGLRMLKLVNEILEIARLEAGAMDLDLHPERPDAAVEDVMITCRREAAQAGVSLRVTGPGRTVRTMTDSRALKTILTTLVQNAIARSPKGQAVDIALRDEAQWVSIEITDRRPGVTPDELARMLGPLQHGANPNGSGEEGAGFGLAIVALLCKAMNGKFSARMADGGGVVAVVRLPAATTP